MKDNDQFDILGSCLSGCDATDILTYKYNVYMLNSTTDQWSSLTKNTYLYEYGLFNSDLTAWKILFQDYSTQLIWKFELTIEIANKNKSGSTSLIVLVNQPPLFGSCGIIPTNGTANTLFDIKCINWNDNPVNYAFYGRIDKNY